jgi:hypothetical protein
LASVAVGFLVEIQIVILSLFLITTWVYFNFLICYFALKVLAGIYCDVDKGSNHILGKIFAPTVQYRSTKTCKNCDTNEFPSNIY